VSGGGLDGRLAFNPVGNIQRIAVSLTADNARFAGPPPLVIRSGKLEGAILLDPAGTSMKGTLTARGLSRGALSIASLNAEGELHGGAGRVSATVAGTRGRDFVFRTVADFAEGRLRLAGEGSVDRRPIRITQPFVFAREGAAWRLSSGAL